MGNLNEPRTRDIAAGYGLRANLVEAKLLAAEVLELRQQIAKKRELPALLTLHDLLPKVKGNKAELARRLNINRGTLRKYLQDKEGRYHRIVDGVFMCTVMSNSEGFCRGE